MKWNQDGEKEFDRNAYGIKNNPQGKKASYNFSPREDFLDTIRIYSCFIETKQFKRVTQQTSKDMGAFYICANRSLIISIKICSKQIDLSGFSNSYGSQKEDYSIF